MKIKISTNVFCLYSLMSPASVVAFRCRNKDRDLKVGSGCIEIRLFLQKIVAETYTNVYRSGSIRKLYVNVYYTYVYVLRIRTSLLNPISHIHFFVETMGRPGDPVHWCFS